MFVLRLRCFNVHAYSLSLFGSDLIAPATAAKCRTLRRKILHSLSDKQTSPNLR